MNTSDSLLICPACTGQNAPDSKFCRHCGHALVGAAPIAASDTALIAAPPVAAPMIAAAPGETSAGGAEMSEDLPSAAELRADDDAEAMSSPGEIDARRARHMLERAQGLSERGDTAGAVLACRQAIALAPAVVGGQAMLGALLERSGDLTHAMMAFEKAAQLAPESGAAREVARLRDKMGVPSENAPVFHFDDSELFGDESSQAAPITAPTEAPAAPTTTAPATVLGTETSIEAAGTGAGDAVPVLDAAENRDAAATSAEPDALSANAVIPTEVVASAPPIIRVVDEVSDAPPAVAAALPPVHERRVANIPVRVERRLIAKVGASLATPIGARIKAPVTATPINPLLLVDSAPKAQGFSAILSRPSFFARSLPLVGATILSLGFLGWTRNWADARSLASGQNVLVIQAPSSEVSTAPASAAPASNLPALAPVGSAPANSGGFPISNQPIPNPTAAGQVATPPLSAGNSTPPAAAVPTLPAPRRVVRAAPVLPPASISSLGPVRSANPPRSGGAGGGAGLTLPPPVITQPAPAAPPVSVAPQGSAGGAGALNPAGSPGAGYTRITRGRVGSILPRRAANSAGDAERAAAAAARGGQPTQAIDGLTTAINANASDAGYRFQQRAMIFLGQGDYARAVDDFQSAISAYNDQIARGEQVASARAGLTASRSGLTRALAAGR